jgi:hypothetical protein
LVSAAVLAAAASALVAITPADAKPIRTGIRSAFGTYLTFMLLSVVDGAESITPYYRRSEAEGFRPAAEWQVKVTGVTAAVTLQSFSGPTRVWLHVVCLFRRSSPRRIRRR